MHTAHTHTHTATIHRFPTAAEQRPSTISLQQALAHGISPSVIRAVANWNERKSDDKRRRSARPRLRAQAEALREVAGRLEIMQHMQMREAA